MNRHVVVALACAVGVAFGQAPNGGSVIETGRPVVRVLFSSDSRAVAGFMPGGIGFWDVASGNSRGAVSWEDRYTPGIAIGTSLDRIAAVGDDGTVSVWKAADAGTPNAIGRVDTSPAVSILSLDGALLAHADHQERRLRLWDTSSGRLRFAVDTGIGHTAALAFSPDGSLLAGANGDTGLYVWRTEDGRVERVIDDLHLVTSALEFTPDGAFLISGGVDRNIYVWDTKTWRRTRQFGQPHPEPIWALDLSPDGRLLVTAGGLDGVPNTPAHLVLWNFESGTELGRLRLTRTATPSVALSPDGALVAVANGENMIHLWRISDLRR